MTGLVKSSMISCALVLAFSSAAVRADDLYSDFSDIGLLLNIAAEAIIQDSLVELAQNDRRYRGERGYRRSPGAHVSPKNRRGFKGSDRRGYGSSYTSQPVRGGSSRRTRIIENPYSNRLVTGITLTGIDNDIVHIKDVISYPHRQLISPFSYTLSAYEPSRFINTRNYIDYISVQAKRKEYFTVTFHYD